MESRARRAIVTIGAILAVSAIGTSATGPLRPHQTRRRIDSAWSPIRSRAAVKSIHSVHSAGAVCTGEVSNEWDVIADGDIEVCGNVRMNRGHDMHVRHFPFADPRIRR
jgi:hypothetical protein